MFKVGECLIFGKGVVRNIPKGAQLQCMLDGAPDHVSIGYDKACWFDHLSFIIKIYLSTGICFILRC